MVNEPQKMGDRRSTVEHQFGTIKSWMGHTRFQMKTMARVSTEMSLHVLSYNLKRVISIKRTPKGHRLYSQQDILCILAVLQLLEQCVAIGSAAKALKNDTVLQGTKTLALKANGEGNTGPTDDHWNIYHQRLISHVNSYDLVLLERLHHEVFSLYPFEIVSRSLIRPVIEELLTQAGQVPSLSGHYYFYKHFLQHKIGALFLRSSLRIEEKNTACRYWRKPGRH